MPELPEVETVMRGLAPKLEGKKIADVVVRRRDLRWPIADDFEKVVRGAQVVALRRRGKYVLVDLSNGQTMLFHLGMSGRVTFDGVEDGVQKHAHVLLTMEDGTHWRFVDARRFGMMLLCETGKVGEHELIKAMGVEPLTEDFNAGYLAARLKGKTQAVKVAIMDGRLVVGVGNIYASESLFRAGILPTKPAAKLTKVEVKKLVAAIKEVLAEAIESGGSSLRDYVQSDGTLGYFQHNFRVYGRGGQPCKKCGGEITQQVLGQRSTFWCKECQR